MNDTSISDRSDKPAQDGQARLPRPQARQGRKRCLLPRARSIAGRLLLAVLVAAPGLAPKQARAQTNAIRPRLPSHRWLLIVDTSRAMQRRSDAVLKAVGDLLGSGVKGQVQPGDTLGVWTFNEKLYAGQFPLQEWSHEGESDVTMRALAFLKAQKYEKQENLARVLPAILGVIKNSDVITVILVSSGDQAIRGTPFDARINKFYEEWRDQQDKARMPFITILRGKRGEVADYAVNAPPWPLQVPALPKEPQPVKTATSEPKPPVHKAAPRMLPPLIISGRKPQPVPAPAPVPAPVASKSEAPAPETVTSAAGTPAPTHPVRQPAEVGKAEAPPGTADTTPAEPSTLSAPAPAITAESQVEMAKAPEPKPPETAPAEPEPVPAATPTTHEPPTSAEAPKTVPASEPMSAPPVVQQSTTAPTRQASSVLAPPVQSAAAVPAGRSLGGWALWVAGAVLLMAAAGFIFVLRRRSRPAPQGSLITRSYERGNKP